MIEEINKYLESFNQVPLFIALGMVTSIATAAIAALTYIINKKNIALASEGRTRAALASENVDLKQELLTNAKTMQSLEADIAAKAAQVSRMHALFPDSASGVHILMHELINLHPFSLEIKRMARNDLGDHLPAYSGRPVISQFAARSAVYLAQFDLFRISEFDCSTRIVSLEFLNDYIHRHLTATPPSDLALFNNLQSEAEILDDLSAIDVLIRTSQLRNDGPAIDSLLATKAIIGYLSSVPLSEAHRKSTQEAVVKQYTTMIEHAQNATDRFQNFPNTSFLLAWTAIKGGIDRQILGLHEGAIIALKSAENFHPRLGEMLESDFAD